MSPLISLLIALRCRPLVDQLAFQVSSPALAPRVSPPYNHLFHQADNRQYFPALTRRDSRRHFPRAALVENRH